MQQQESIHQYSRNSLQLRKRLLLLRQPRLAGAAALAGQRQLRPQPLLVILKQKGRCCIHVAAAEAQQQRTCSAAMTRFGPALCGMQPRHAACPFADSSMPTCSAAMMQHA